MKFKEYIPLAIRTESSLNPFKKEVEERGLTARLFHGIQGIITEKDEFREAIKNNDNVNALEEVGDMLWYLAIIADELNDNNFINEIEEIFNTDLIKSIEFDTILVNSFDNSKKTLFYGKEFDIDALKKDLLDLCYFIRDATYDNSIELLMISNIEKLSARYPNKFTQVDALQRDLKKEREILERNLTSQ